MKKIAIAVIGGSGLYQINELKNPQEHWIDTPFGKPSDAIFTGFIGDVEVAFLARHGRGHQFIPSEVPYLANIYALKSLGVKYIISISAVGSLKAHIKPLDMLLPDQFIDQTKSRTQTFFGNGAVAHISMAQPVCSALANILAESVERLNIEASHLHRTGTYVCIEGPSFSTRAESEWYRSMGASVIGMTNMPEAKLAREASIAYATLALVTDYDSWNQAEESVNAEMAIANLMKNAVNAQRVVVNSILKLGELLPSSQAHNALDAALVTPRDHMSPETQSRIAIFL
jgi:5'-methylthioadenosine phosphorylase